MKRKQPLLQAALIAGLSIFSLGAQAALSDLPNLPVGIKEGGGALIGDTVYVGLGADNSDFYALNLKEPKAWEKLPAFPGGERKQPVVNAVDGKLFVFGGLQVNEKGELALVNDAYCYDPAKKEWEKLPTRSPLGLVGASSAVHDDKIYIIGGSNLSIFNGIFQDLTAAGEDKEKKDALLAAYFDQRPEDYFFNTTLFSYQPATNKWRNEGALPFSGRAGAAVATKGDRIDVINGEIKPGLRTAEAEQGTFNKSGGVDWIKLPNLPDPAKDVVQDGLAGAYIGYSHGKLLVAGGANFPGSNKQFNDGQLYAHKGLKKTYQQEIYALSDDKKWSVIGKLPEGAGYGVSVSYDDVVLLIGGEADGKKTLNSVQVIEFKE